MNIPVSRLHLVLMVVILIFRPLIELALVGSYSNLGLLMLFLEFVEQLFSPFWLLGFTLRSWVNIKGLPLCLFFSIEAFNHFSFFCMFNILIIICYRKFLFWPKFFGILYVSNIFIATSFIRLGNFLQ